MTRYELRRIAQVYGATEAEVREAELRARLEPMVPLAQAFAKALLPLWCEAPEDDA